MFSPDNITNEIVICDRSLPDILSHTKFIFTETKEDDLLKRIMEQVTYVWLSSFDYIFYAQLSEELQIESDDIREVDRNFQEKLQSCHQEILKKSECRFHYLPTSIPDRVEFIMNFLIGD
jgi:predicted ATPase